ncbi:polysaccharide deacetylase family protein [Actinomadura sp. ATCC 39365]
MVSAQAGWGLYFLAPPILVLLAVRAFVRRGHLADRGGEQVPAVGTMFVQGRWAQANPSLAEDLAAGGHLIGNHSHHHAPMTWLSPKAFDRDVQLAERAIRRATGHDPRPWFRCPFGDGSEDPAIRSALDRLGYQETSWHVDPFDWRGKATGPSVARLVIEEATAHGDGAVVLLHPWTKATGRALPLVIDGLRAAGARFVRMDELV